MAAEKIMSRRKKPRLIRIDGFWRNNTPEGFGFNFVGQDVQFVSTVITDLYRKLKRAPEFESFLSDVAPAQLLQAGKAHKLRLQGNRDKELERIVIVYGVANVYILEQEKRLLADEYNGMVFTFGVPGRGVFIDPELHVGEQRQQ
jgi:hypothetical protein